MGQKPKTGARSKLAFPHLCIYTFTTALEMYILRKPSMDSFLTAASDWKL